MLKQDTISVTGIAVCCIALLSSVVAAVDLTPGSPAPEIRALDIQGQSVELSRIIARNPYLLIVYCFTPNTGEDLALQLQRLQNTYGNEKLEVVALGVEQDERALQDFAARLGIRHHVINAAKLEDNLWLLSIRQYPLTLFVETMEEGRIDRVLAGEGISTTSLLTHIAETFFRQNRPEALAIINEAADTADEHFLRAASPEQRTSINEAAQDTAATTVTELRGYILRGEGKLDEAEQEFDSIDSYAGLARVALDRGNIDKAILLAEQADDNGYALSVKADALALSGKIDDAVAAFDSLALESISSQWQASEAVNSRGRIRHYQGDLDGAISDYRTAREIDSYGIKPLSNEAVALREQGKLEEAETLLESAQRFSDDSLVMLLLQQVRQEREAAIDLQRQEFIRSQIHALSERFRNLRAEGLATPVDPWSTRPFTVALLPNKQDSVYFERPGTDIALQREIESRLQADARVEVLERAMLEQLLQELELGVSDLTDPMTQQVLGRVLSARYLGFIDYVQLGVNQTVWLRLVDTETTGIALQTSQPVSATTVTSAAEQLTARVLEDLADTRKLQGLIADITDNNHVIVNLGRRHGVREGQSFDVIDEGDAIEVGGRVIAHRRLTVGRIEITAVEEAYAIGEIVDVSTTTVIQKDMKIKASNPVEQQT